jgi:hypothetical protein
MAESLAALGWDDDWAVSFSELDRVGGRPARVTAQHRDRWTAYDDPS